MMSLLRTLGRVAGGCSLAPMAGPFLDGEISETEARRFRDHLTACPVCRRELRAMRRLSHLLSARAAGGPWPTGPEDIAVCRVDEVHAHVNSSPNPAVTRLATALAGGNGRVWR